MLHEFMPLQPPVPIFEDAALVPHELALLQAPVPMVPAAFVQELFPEHAPVAMSPVAPEQELRPVQDPHPPCPRPSVALTCGRRT